MCLWVKFGKKCAFIRSVAAIFGDFCAIFVNFGGGQRFVSVIFGDFKRQNFSTRGESGALPPGGPALSGRPACIHYTKIPSIFTEKRRRFWSGGCRSQIPEKI